jgi:hypothetical protein
MTAPQQPPAVKPLMNSNQEFVGVRILGRRYSLADLERMEDQMRIYDRVIAEYRERLHAGVIATLHGTKEG